MSCELVEASAANSGRCRPPGPSPPPAATAGPAGAGRGGSTVRTVRVDFDGPERLARYIQRRSEDGGPYGEPVAWRSLTGRRPRAARLARPGRAGPRGRLTLQEDLGGDADPLTAAIGLGPDEWPAAEIAEDLADAGGPGRRWRLVAAAEGGRLDGVPVVFAAFRGLGVGSPAGSTRPGAPCRSGSSTPVRHPGGAVTTQVHVLRRLPSGRRPVVGPAPPVVAPLDGGPVIAAATIDVDRLGRQPARGALRLDFDSPVRVLSEIKGVPASEPRRSWDFGALAGARAAGPFEAAGPAGRLVDRSMPLGLLLLVGLAVRSALHHRPTAGRPGADPS